MNHFLNMIFVFSILKNIYFDVHINEIAYLKNSTLRPSSGKMHIDRMLCHWIKCWSRCQLLIRIDFNCIINKKCQKCRAPWRPYQEELALSYLPRIDLSLISFDCVSLVKKYWWNRGHFRDHRSDFPHRTNV